MGRLRDDPDLVNVTRPSAGALSDAFRAPDQLCHITGGDYPSMAPTPTLEVVPLPVELRWRSLIVRRDRFVIMTHRTESLCDDMLIERGT